METPNNFNLLYTCSIQLTGHQVYKTPAMRPTIKPLTEEEKQTYPIENEIAIKMPESEYLRFVENWNNYLTLMRGAQVSDTIKSEYNRLLILSQMLT